MLYVRACKRCSGTIEVILSERSAVCLNCGWEYYNSVPPPKRRIGNLRFDNEVLARLRTIRQAKLMSQELVAMHLSRRGIPCKQRWLCSWERGEALIPTDAFLGLCWLYDIAPKDLTIEPIA